MHGCRASRSLHSGPRTSLQPKIQWELFAAEKLSLPRTRRHHQGAHDLRKLDEVHQSLGTVDASLNWCLWSYITGGTYLVVAVVWKPTHDVYVCSRRNNWWKKKGNNKCLYTSGTLYQAKSGVSAFDGNSVKRGSHETSGWMTMLAAKHSDRGAWCQGDLILSEGYKKRMAPA